MHFRSKIAVFHIRDPIFARFIVFLLYNNI